jgi:RNA polymerase sigma factor (sigma-70 family)
MMEPTTRHSLLLRLHDPKDDASWTEFVRIYEPLILRLALKKGLQEADAHDLSQEVLRAVAASVHRWDPDKGTFRSWLFRIARNLLVNFLISQGRQPRASGRTSMIELLNAQPARDAGAEAEFALEFKWRAFHWAAEQIRDQFSLSTWQAFWRTGVENRTVAMVAAELGLSEGAVYIARSRVLARLRECVQQLTDDSGLERWGADHGAAYRAV